MTPTITMDVLGWVNLGWAEIMIILIVALLLFGRRLPEVGRSLGQGLVEFKRGLKDASNEVDSVRKETDKIADDVNRAVAADEKPSSRA